MLAFRNRRREIGTRLPPFARGQRFPHPARDGPPPLVRRSFSGCWPIVVSARSGRPATRPRPWPRARPRTPPRKPTEAHPRGPPPRGEERAQGDKEGPQHEHVLGQTVGHGIDDAQAEQEDHLVSAHAVANVVQRVQGGGPENGRCGSEGGFQPPLDEPAEEDGFEHAHGERHEQEGNPVHRSGKVIAPERDGELDSGEQQPEAHRAPEVVEPDAQRGQRSASDPHRVDDGPGYPDEKRRAEREEQSRHAVRGEHGEGHAEQSHDRHVQSPDHDEVLPVHAPATPCDR